MESRPQAHQALRRAKTGISPADAEFLFQTFCDHDMDKDDKISFGELKNKISLIAKGNM
jgi:hypothetical protein